MLLPVFGPVLLPPSPSFLLTWGMGVFQHLFVNFLHLHVFEMNVLRYILLLHVDVLQFYNYVHVLEVSAYGGLVYKGGLKWLIFLVIFEVCFVYRSLLIVSTYIHTCFFGDNCVLFSTLYLHGFFLAFDFLFGTV